MCFSATASFVAGVSLSAIGIATIKKTKKRSEVPFAAIPLIFGLQQLVEGFVWLSFDWHNTALNYFATQFSYIFSNVWWPIFLPAALILIETAKRRKKILFVFEAIGLFVGSYFLYFMAVAPVTSEVLNRCIVYRETSPYHFVLAALYPLATSFSCFVSSKKVVNILGLLILASFAIAYVFYSEALVSIWCFFAALLSIVIYLYFSKSRS